jgi:hypothetical protein
MFTVTVSNLQLHMFTYCPMDVTSQCIVSISVFRWRKCCVTHNNMFLVSFCLIAHSAFAIIWVFRDVPLMITSIECLTLGCCHSPFRPELHNHARDFSLSTYGLSRSGRIVHALVSSEFCYHFAFNAGLLLILDNFGTFRLIAQCLNHLRHCVPLLDYCGVVNSTDEHYRRTAGNRD